MAPVVVFPDATEVVLAAIADELAVQTCGAIPDGRSDADTFVLCRRVGGTQHDIVVDDATVAVEAWAPSPEAAHDLIQQVRGVLHSLVGTVFYRVQEFAGPAYLPDPDSSHPRYTLTASVSVRGSTVSGS